MNNPRHIQFLVNPDQKTIAIKACNAHTKNTHKIIYKTSSDCEFYSKELLFQLCKVCPDLVPGFTYKLPGTLHPDKGVALFLMDNLIPVYGPAFLKNSSEGQSI